MSTVFRIQEPWFYIPYPHSITLSKLIELFRASISVCLWNDDKGGNIYLLSRAVLRISWDNVSEKPSSASFLFLSWVVPFLFFLKGGYGFEGGGALHPLPCLW